MNQDNENVSYLGFTPEAGTHRSALRLIENIEALAPSDAAVSLVLRQISQGGFTGRLAVTSSVGRFSTEEKREELEALMGELSNSICLQLDRWRKGRFDINAG